MVITGVAINTFGQKFWLATNSFPGGPKTAITLSGDHCLFVGTLNGVLRSCDDGNSWDTMLEVPAIFSLYTTQSGRVLAGGAGKIYVTDDMGASWDTVSLNHAYPVTLFIQNVTSEIYAITGALDIELGYVGAGVFHSATHGSSWSQRNSGLGPYTSCERIAHDSKGRVYLGVADEYVSGNGGLFFSDNQGVSWEHMDIRMDGQQIIDDKIKIGNIRGLSVSPYDSVFISISGVSVNVGVDLNLHKSTQDMADTIHWIVTTVSNTSIWWNDRLLNNMHFASNGDWYSSMRGSLITGGTFFSSNTGQSWNRHPEGLGLDQYGSFSNQVFAALASGRVYMIQSLDERVYWTDTSLLSAIDEQVRQNAQKVLLFPNPTHPGNEVWIKVSDDSILRRITISNLMGQVVSDFSGDGLRPVHAPQSPGHYILSVYGDDGRIVHLQLLVV